MARVRDFLHLLLLFAPNLPPVKGERLRSRWGVKTPQPSLSIFTGSDDLITEERKHHASLFFCSSEAIARLQPAFFSLYPNVRSSSPATRDCRSLPAPPGRNLHLRLRRRRSRLPAAEPHHCQQSPGGASAAARAGDVQVGQKQSSPVSFRRARRPPGFRGAYGAPFWGSPRLQNQGFEDRTQCEGLLIVLVPLLLKAYGMLSSQVWLDGRSDRRRPPADG